jgi:8-oxo-dGTP diphosphatase
MEEPQIIRKTALAVFADKKMLMVRSSKNEEVFYTLGGKIEENESEIDSLHREIHEEVGCEIKGGSLTFLHEFEAPAHGRENTLVNIRLYKGQLTADPIPSSEIVEVAYFDSTVSSKHLSPITVEIFDWLKEAGYIR